MVAARDPGLLPLTGDTQLDRERSYYAALIAASDHKYVIAGTDTPRQLEIEYRSAYKPQQRLARWLIDVGPDAALKLPTTHADGRGAQTANVRAGQSEHAEADATRAPARMRMG